MEKIHYHSSGYNREKSKEEDLLYCRGFYLSKSENIFKSFLSTKFCNYNFNYHPALDVVCKSEGRFSLILAGTFIDIRDGCSDINSNFEKIFSAIKEGGGFYDEIDFFSGRYLILYNDGNGIRALTDATGMRSIFYTKDFKNIASHCNILRDLGYGKNPSHIEKYRRDYLSEEGIAYKYGYPGFYTPFEDCHILPPNFEIILENKKIRRFFPRASLDLGQDVNDSIIKVNRYMRNQVIGILAKNKNVYCSLTSGIDSRFTLTATSGFDEIKYFTYRYLGNVSHETDLNWGSIIADAMNFSHLVLDIDKRYNFNSEDFNKFSKAISFNTTFTPHARKIAYAYFKEFGDENYLIRSNLYEIGRAYYHSKVDRGVKAGKLTPGDIAKTLLYAYDERLVNHGVLSKAFSDYVCELPSQDLIGYDFLDLFYWEHRMGVWHSQVVTESDPSFETLVLCNSREIIKLLLSFPLVERKASSFFKSSISQYLTNIKNIPYNKKIENAYDTFHVEATISGGRLTGRTYTSYSWENPSFAYYIFLNGRRIAVRWYEKDPSFTIDLDVPGSYSVRGFVKSGNGSPVAKSTRTLDFLGHSNEVALKDFDNIIPGRNNFVTDDYVYETFFKRGTTNKLVVLLNGAVGDRSKVKLPVFQRNSWGRDIDDHVLNISDPTLNLDPDLRLGWYYGTVEKPVTPSLSELIIKVSKHLDVSCSDIVIYGSSGGGFAALMLSAYIGNNSKAVAINPQIVIGNYVSKSAVERFYNVCVLPYSKQSEELIFEIPNGDVREAWGKSKNSECLIYQNKLDKHHYEFHFCTFLDYFSMAENKINFQKNIKTITFEDARGHVGEKRSDFKKLIDLVRS